MNETDEPLTTFLGAPIEPHRVDGVEAERYYCSTCGQDVQHDGDAWFHVDVRYEPEEPA